MSFAITQLNPAESARLLVEALSAHWTESHFSVRFSDDGMHLEWQNGPVEKDVAIIIDRYQPCTDLSEWQNAVFLAHPDGALEAVLPCFDPIHLHREYTGKVVRTITARLRKEGIPITGNAVARILNAGDTDNPHTQVVQDYAAETNAPLLDNPWVSEAHIFDDDDIECLCDAIDQWGRDPEHFDQWPLVVSALHDMELRSIIVSTLSVDRPYPGAMKSLLNEIIMRCHDTGDLASASEAQRVKALIGDADGLFPMPATKESTMLTEMGQLLRMLVGADY